MGLDWDALAGKERGAFVRGATNLLHTGAAGEGACSNTIALQRCRCCTIFPKDLGGKILGLFALATCRRERSMLGTTFYLGA